jgi:hypothetical protein
MGGSRAGSVSLSLVDVDWKSKDSVCAFIDGCMTQRERMLAGRDRQNEINISWYRGFQETFWNSNLKQMYRQPNPYGRTRLIYNQIGPLVDGFVSKLVSDQLNFESSPATGDMEDQEVAQVQEPVLNYYKGALDLERLRRKQMLWTTVCAYCFIKVVWDPGKGSELDISPADLGITPVQFEKQYGKMMAELKTGDLSVSIAPPFNVFWGPYGAEFEDAEWVLEVYERSSAYVMERYDLDAEQVRQSYDSAARVWRPGISGAYGSNVDAPESDCCLVQELWVKPNSKIAPLGRHVVYVGTELVDDENGNVIPYRHQKIPLVMFPLSFAPGDPVPMTSVDNMIAPQANFNRTMSQNAENRELMANPVWLARTGSIPTLTDWTSRPGGIRYYNGEKPSLEQGAAMPNSVYIGADKDNRQMQDAISLRDVSNAKVPTGVKSGRAILALQEADELRIGPIDATMKEGWSKVGQLMLQTLNQYCTEDRYIKILGDEKAWETLVFKGGDLSGQKPGVNYYDVKVTGTGQIKSRAGRIELLMSMLSTPVPVLNPLDPKDKEFILSALGFTGDPNTPIDPVEDDRQQQRKENQLMMRGQYLPPQSWENGQVHLEELDKFRKRDFFQKLPPQIQALFQQHWEETIGMMALKQPMMQAAVQKALETAGVIAGPPPSPGGPPQLPAPNLTSQVNSQPENGNGGNANNGTSDSSGTGPDADSGQAGPS